MNLAQVIIALAALAGITLLGVRGTVDGDAILAIYSAIIGAVLAGGGATLANGITVSTFARGEQAGAAAQRVSDDHAELEERQAGASS